MVRPGNIDLSRRPKVRNRDGSVSTVKSFSIGVGRHEILLPQVVGRKVVSIPEAIAHFQRTNQHLGIFNSVKAANAYAQTLHESQAHEYTAPSGRVPHSVNRSLSLAQREGGIGTRPSPRAHGGGGGFKPVPKARPQTPADLQAQVRRRLAAPATPGQYKSVGSGLSALNAFIGVRDLRHPIRSLEQSRAEGAAVGRQIQSGKLALGDTAPYAGSAIFPGGGPFKGTTRLLGRLFGRGAEVAAEVPKPLGRPRTRAEAEVRLKQLDKREATLRDKLVPTGKYKSIDPQEQARRNVISGKAAKAGKGEQVAGGRKAVRGVEPTLSHQFEAEVEKEVARISAAKPNHPLVKALAQTRAEAEQLRAGLHDQFFPGEEPAATAQSQALGHLAAGEKPLGAEEVRKSLPEMKQLAKERQLARSEALSARVGKGEQAKAAASDPLSGHYAFKRELKGALPTNTFTRLQEGTLRKEDLQHMVRQIDDHPDLRPFEKSNAADALLNAIEHGTPPRPFEIKQLERVFGPDVAAELSKLSKMRRMGLLAVDVMNLPRALMASADVSFPLRQGLVVAHSHPRIFASGFKPMFKALRSVKGQNEVNDAIRNHPMYERAVEAGVPFSELGDFRTREEAFQTSITEKIPVVRASSRAYTTAANYYRMKLFERLVKDAEAGGKGVLSHVPGFRGTPKTDTAEFDKQVAKIVGTFTGRGTGSKGFEAAAPYLNNIFFAPRLIKSRVNLLNPFWYPRLDPFARRQAFRALVRMAGTTALLLEAAHLFTGASVETDPRNADFAKIRFGNTRIDIGGGFQQYIRLVSQLATKKVISSTTGRTMTLGPGMGKMSQWDIGERFVVGKASPPASFIHDFMTGTQFDGQPFSVKKAVMNRIVPLVIQDAQDLQREQGSAPLTAVGYGAAAFGLGLQTYGNLSQKKIADKTKKAKDTQNVHLDNLVKHGLLPAKERPAYREALDAYNQREAANHNIELDTVNKPRTRENQKMDALLKLLHKHGVLSAKRLRDEQDYYHRADLSPKAMQADREWFWKQSGFGEMYTWYKKQSGGSD